MMEERQTEFNSNLATLERIDASLKGCRQARFEDNLKGYFKFAEDLMNEVIVKMPTDMETECLEKYERLLKLHSLLEQRSKGVSVEFKGKFRKDIMDFELYLRKYANKKGMLLRDTDDKRGL